MSPLEKLAKIYAESVQKNAANDQALRQAQQRKTKAFGDALRAAVELPEQIDQLTAEVEKVVVVATAQIEIAKAQKELSEKAAAEAENLSKQTDRLVSETIIL